MRQENYLPWHNNCGMCKIADKHIIWKTLIAGKLDIMFPFEWMFFLLCFSKIEMWRNRSRQDSSGLFSCIFTCQTLSIKVQSSAEKTPYSFQQHPHVVIRDYFLGFSVTHLNPCPPSKTVPVFSFWSGLSSESTQSVWHEWMTNLVDTLINQKLLLHTTLSLFSFFAWM